MTNPHDPAFAPWQACYRDDSGTSAALAVHTDTEKHVILTTALGERLHFTPIETALLIDAIASALRKVSPTW